MVYMKGIKEVNKNKDSNYYSEGNEIKEMGEYLIKKKQNIKDKYKNKNYQKYKVS